MIPIAHPLTGDEEIQGVTEVLRSGELAAGSWVTKFEENFRDYLGAGHAVATSSGTTALQAALQGLGIGPGDLVITTPFSFIATSNAILHVGAIPIFVDIDPFTFNLNPELVERACRHIAGIKAVLLVHLFGHPAAMDKIMKISQEYGLKVIEDCAQAHGAEFISRKVGTFGDAATYSFYPTKNMTTGEGGMVICKEEAVAKRVRKIVNHGQEIRYIHDMLGYNFRMTNLQAIIGLQQLIKLPNFNLARRRNAESLTNGINQKDIKTPQEVPGCTHVYHQYTIRIKNNKRDLLASHLHRMGVGCQIHYPRLIYHQPLYQSIGFRGSCPEAEMAAREVLSLPVHPALGEKDLEHIIKSINTFL